VVMPPETCRKNKRCNVASCWLSIRILLRCTDPWTLNTHQQDFSTSQSYPTFRKWISSAEKAMFFDKRVLLIKLGDNSYSENCVLLTEFQLFSIFPTSI
jgi:hypothetical protein